jgi:hypothetical protein
MSDTEFRAQDPALYRTGMRANRGAIWAGVFSFAAIWTVFEALGLAIFPGAPATQGGASVGMAIWTIVLTIIAMYVAGLETGRLVGATTRHEGLIHGIIMFGLSVVSTIVLTSLVSGFWLPAAAGRGQFTLTFNAGAQWAEFLALFLGWLAAMGGASAGVTRRYLGARQPSQPVEMRPAA